MVDIDIACFPHLLYAHDIVLWCIISYHGWTYDDTISASHLPILLRLKNIYIFGTASIAMWIFGPRYRYGGINPAFSTAYIINTPISNFFTNLISASVRRMGLNFSNLLAPGIFSNINERPLHHLQNVWPPLIAKCTLSAWIFLSKPSFATSL